MACSHVCNVDDSLVAKARGPEVDALLLAKLEILAAALAWQERCEEILHDAHLLVL